MTNADNSDTGAVKKKCELHVSPLIAVTLRVPPEMASHHIRDFVLAHGHTCSNSYTNGDGSTEWTFTITQDKLDELNRLVE